MEEQRLKEIRRERKKFEKELKGKILPYKSLEELLKDYRSAYQDIKNRFPNINIEFVKDNYNTASKLYNINVKKLSYDKYIAYKLLKILITHTNKENKIFGTFKLDKVLDKVLDEKLITKKYTECYELYNSENTIDYYNSGIVKKHERLVNNLLELEKMILDFIKFVKDIDEKAFMDNVNFKWEIMQYIKEKSLKPIFNPKISPKTSPKISPLPSYKSSPKSSPKTSPKTSPKISPKLSPKASPKALSSSAVHKG